MSPLTHRKPAVAGMFYPEEPSELQEHINGFLYEELADALKPPKALVVPHAGTVFSGSIAAAAYRQLQQYRHVIRKVIMLGPTHRVALDGLGLPSVQSFQTPLGEVKLDTKTISKLVDDFPQVHYSDSAHAQEHSLEVQLPFLQSVLAKFRLIPFAVGDASESDVADVISKLWGGDECLIVISTDLSHFHDYHTARSLDAKTATLIEEFKGAELPDHSACGRVPLRGMLKLARQRKMSIKRYDLRNSGDTAGPRDQVVGYGSWGLFE